MSDKSPNNLVTKSYLDEKLKTFGKELRGELSELAKDLRGEMSTIRGEMSKVKTEMSEMKNDIVCMKDEIVGELKAIREEFETHQFQHQTTNDTLDDHETRLRNIEKPTSCSL